MLEGRVDELRKRRNVLVVVFVLFFFWFFENFKIVVPVTTISSPKLGARSPLYRSRIFTDTVLV